MAQKKVTREKDQTAIAPAGSAVSASADVSPEPVVATPAPEVHQTVSLVNLSADRAIHVPLKSGFVRLAPKEDLRVSEYELTPDAFRVEAEGRITIRTL